MNTNNPSPTAPAPTAADSNPSVRVPANFGKLSLGDRFHVGKSFGIGAQSHVQSWLVYEKTGKSSARVVEQHGNYRRQLGDVATFHHVSRVFQP